MGEDLLYLATVAGVCYNLLNIPDRTAWVAIDTKGRFVRFGKPVGDRLVRLGLIKPSQNPEPKLIPGGYTAVA